MSAKLSLSPSTTPFPYAALVTATFTGKAVVEFDPDVTTVTLEWKGKRLTTEDEIVNELANDAGIAGDSTKVCVYSHFF